MRIALKALILSASLTCLCGFRGSQAAVQVYRVAQTTDHQEGSSNSPLGKARLRINNDGLMFYVYSGTDCAPKQAEGVGQYSPSQNRSIKEVLLFRKPKPSSIGMPRRAQMPVTYNEYRVPAGVPITVATGFYADAGPANSKGLNVTTTCGPVFSTFIPKEGRDYELESPSRKNVCSSVVIELDASGEKSVRPVNTSPTSVCTQGETPLVPIETGAG